MNKKFVIFFYTDSLKYDRCIIIVNSIYNIRSNIKFIYIYIYISNRNLL